MAKTQMVKDVDEGMNLYLEYELNEALTKLTPEAENGDGCAMFILSNIYADGGLGIKPDNEQSQEWVKKGWKMGDELCSLFHALFSELDTDEKKMLCQKYKPLVINMANEGNVLAANLIGISYMNETDEEINYQKAVYWFEKASEMGYWRADRSVGLRYLNGEGVGQDYVKAVEYFKKAAKVGDIASQYHLGRCYYYGWGVEKDDVRARQWLKRAARQRENKVRKTGRRN